MKVTAEQRREQKEKKRQENEGDRDAKDRWGRPDIGQNRLQGRAMNLFCVGGLSGLIPQGWITSCTNSHDL